MSGASKIAKTKEMAEFLAKLGVDFKVKRFTILLSESAKPTFRFLKNLKNLNTVPFNVANAFDIWNSGLLILDENIFGDQVKGERQEVKENKKSAVKRTVKKPSNKVTK